MFKDIHRKKLNKVTMIIDKVTQISLHVAARIRQFRVASGMSQEELGDIIGVTFQQIQKYETAKNRVSVNRLYEIAQILEKPLDAFFSGIEADRDYYNYDFTSDKSRSQKMRKNDKDLRNLVSAFNRIENQAVKKNLIALANSVAKPKRRRIKHSYS